ncbi:MAG: hypothetical protein K0R39_5210, partial [Symbiobacteriaceae bacterium]|nr:hypothetical protein [Symbiobacteriaceae bacterium]
MRYFILLVTCLALLLAPAGVAMADSAPMQTVGPHVQPMDSTTVRLESERIDIHLREDREEPTQFSYSGVADYRIQFHFVPSADERMTAGFPLFVYDPEARIYGAHLENFKVLVGGQEIATRMQGGFMNGTNVDWALFDLTFQAGKPLELEVSYSLEAIPYGKTQAADLWIAYVLRTGAFWAGTIGHAEAHLTMDRPIRAEDVRSGEGFWRSTTPGWRLEGGALHWTWKDVEPDFDLSAVLANSYWIDSPAALAELAAAGAPDRNGCLKLMHGMAVLFEGDGRGGYWTPVRGGKLSGLAGGELWPDVAPVLQGCLARAPKDEELRDRYLRLLSSASWHWQDGKISLVSEERFRLLMREYRAFREAGGREAGVLLVTPWLQGEVEPVTFSAETQAEVVAYLLKEEIYSSYATEQAARDWTATVAKPLGPQAAEALLKEALARVKQAPAAPAPAPAQDPGRAPAAPA